MLELVNPTPLCAALVPGLTKEGADTVTVVVKGTFSLRGRSGDEPKLHDEQEPIAYTDDYYGDPGVSSVRAEAETAPAKKRTDIVMLGHAYAPRPGPSVDVRLSVGLVERTVRVLGDRVWHRGARDYRPTDPVAFERMPLVWERAFGGIDGSDPDPTNHAREARNPIGTGFVAAMRAERVDGLRLPNLEDPEALITSPLDRPQPFNFGYIGRDFAPRAAFAGTYDDAWKRDVCPLLPADFDERYFHGAAPGLITSRPLRGGEPVYAQNVTTTGPLQFLVPARRIRMEVTIRNAVTEHPAVLDTLRIEPDEKRAVVLWKVTVPCPQSLLHVRRIAISESKEAA